MLFRAVALLTLWISLMTGISPARSAYGHILTPSASVTPTHDLDGNLTFDVGSNYKDVGDGVVNGVKGTIDSVASIPEIAEFLASDEAAEMIDRLINDPDFRDKMADHLGDEFCDFYNRLKTQEGAFETYGEAAFGVLTGAGALKLIKAFKAAKAAGRFAKAVPSGGHKPKVGYQPGDKLPNGRIAGEGPGAAFEGEFRPRSRVDIQSQSGELIDSADKVRKLTVAGRALDKHGSQQGKRAESSAFPEARGNQAAKNAQGQFQLDDILTDPNQTSFPNGKGGVDIHAGDGRGARFDADDTFTGFLEPRRQ